jgi:hypothetical protein
MWCRPKRNNTQLHTLHTHQVGKKKRRQVGRSCIPPPPPPLKLGSIVFGRLELLPLQSRCDRLPSRFIIIPVQFGVARVLTWVVKIISRSNRFVVFKYFFGTQKQKSSTLFVCCNQKRPENSGNQSVCVCVCVCDIDRITNPKEKNSNLNTRAGSSRLVAFTFRFFLGLSQLQKQPCVCVCMCVCVCVWSFTDQFTPWDTSTHRLVSVCLPVGRNSFIFFLSPAGRNFRFIREFQFLIQGRLYSLNLFFWD